MPLVDKARFAVSVDGFVALRARRRPGWKRRKREEEEEEREGSRIAVYGGGEGRGKKR